MSSLSNSDIGVISSDTKKRLISDIKDLYKNPLDDLGIYYKHDESNMLKGTAMIIGPKDTPYEHGFYLFDFDFPTNYPYSPPKLKYLTNNGRTRFNPNLYVNGKVCLSILNTWTGECWSSCQTIRSILVTIVSSVLNENPLINEPGITLQHPECNKYNKVIKYCNYKTALLGVLQNEIAHDTANNFKCDIIEYLKKNREIILKELKELSEEYNYISTIYINVYNNFKTVIKYESLYKKITSAFQEL